MKRRPRRGYESPSGKSYHTTVGKRLFSASAGSRTRSRLQNVIIFRGLDLHVTNESITWEAGGALVCWKSSIRIWLISLGSSTGFLARNWELDYKALTVILWLCLHSTADPVSMSLPYAISRPSGIAGSGSNHVIASPTPNCLQGRLEYEHFSSHFLQFFYFPPGGR